MSPSGTVSAIVLAAGFSRRMGRSKPLLPMGGRTVVEQVVTIYREAGVADIRVVTGATSDSVRSALAGMPAACIRNPNPERGMFSSVLIGVTSMPPETRAFFVHPVDIPLVRPHTLTMLLKAAETGSAPVIYPTFNGRRGHPPLIDERLKPAILSHDGRGGLQGVLARCNDSAQEIPVADEGIRLDMDTPADHRRLVARRQSGAIPTAAECRTLMRQIATVPASVDRHCRQVARVACRLAEGVNRGGGAVNIPLIRAAARVHDCARLETDHAAAGARLLDAMGFPVLAAIVARHMEIPDTPDADLDEAQIVYLADKLVDGEAVADLEQRFAAKLQHVGDDADAMAAVRRRRRSAVTIQAKVERLAGIPVAQLLGNE